MPEIPGANRKARMKQLIIIIGTVILGGILFQMMVGEQPDSMKSTVREIMISSIAAYTEQGDGTF